MGGGVGLQRLFLWWAFAIKKLDFARQSAESEAGASSQSDNDDNGGARSRGANPPPRKFPANRENYRDLGPKSRFCSGKRRNIALILCQLTRLRPGQWATENSELSAGHQGNEFPVTPHDSTAKAEPEKNVQEILNTSPSPPTGVSSLHR